MTITQEQLIEDVQAREKVISKIWVLEKVKGLLLLPSLEMATTRQVADFFNSKQSTIRTVYQENRKELEEDGVTLHRFKDVKNKVKTDNQTLLSAGVAYRGTYLFPKRAVLRVGMLLRDSEVAKEVRTQLLNIEEKAPDAVKVHEVNKEQELQAAVGAAMAKGDTVGAVEAMVKLQEYENRFTKQTNEILANKHMKFKDNGKVLLALIRRYGGIKYTPKYAGKAWHDLHHYLLYKLDTGINIYSRKRNAIKRGDKYANLNTVITEDEYPTVIQGMVAMCESNGIDV